MGLFRPFIPNSVDSGERVQTALEDAMGTKWFNLRAHVWFYVVLVLDEVVPKSISAKQGLFYKNIHKSLKNEGN